MPVKNQLKRILEDRFQKPLTAYRFRKLSGLGQATSLKINDPFWVPRPETLETICKTFNLQPGDFLFYEEDSENSSI
ncbi:helix-turn-helix transcriptional regulator [Microcoleus sp. PH2017_34_RAT_O_A]|uniref:helix-turn-helix domain-containing protein n=1 Tax=unclassified Microcoleus TaxID=2642155 RepID=UPI0034182A4C